MENEEYPIKPTISEKSDNPDSGTESPMQIPILLEDLNKTENGSENQSDSLLAEDEELELVDNCDVVVNDVAESFYTVINSILRFLDLIITDVGPSDLLIVSNDETSSGEENVSDDSGKCSGLNEGFMDFTN